MQSKGTTSEIRTRTVRTLKDPDPAGGTDVRSTMHDIERAEDEGMGTPEPADSEERHAARRRELSPRAMAFDLTAEASRLTFGDSGQNARPLVKYDGLRLVLMRLEAGKTIEMHQASYQMTIHAVSGHVVLHVDGLPVDLPSGRVCVLDRDVAHDIVAKENSTLLVTVAGHVTE